MNIVMVQHTSGKQYAFYVPSELLPHIKKGCTVVVDTKYGVELGIAETDIFSGAGALDIALQKGAYEPLKPVIGFAPDCLKSSITNELLQKINDTLNSGLLPF